MLNFEKMARSGRRLKMPTGMSLREFDFLYAKVEKTYRGEERKRLSKRPRQRAIGAGRRFALNPRDRALPFLSCHRTYAIQDVAVEVFGVGQATVSRSVDQMAPILARCLPTPEKPCARAKRVSTLEELEELFPQLVCLTDASEQKIQRPKRKDMEKSHFSGKAGTHTAKVQHVTGVHGLIVHKTRHSPGRVHDVKVYKIASHLSQEPVAPRRRGRQGRARGPAALS